MGNRMLGLNRKLGSSKTATRDVGSSKDAAADIEISLQSLDFFYFELGC